MKPIEQSSRSLIKEWHMKQLMHCMFSAGNTNYENCRTEIFQMKLM